MGYKSGFYALVTLSVYYAWLGAALDNGLGQTPPLGFNTWNYFGCAINETVIRVAAAKLVSLGLAEAGYSYLNIDDCWAKRSRSDQGQLEPDPVRFPSGMRAVADYVHSQGLKFGIYADAGLFTCAGFPGSRFHEADDAALFASWGVDYLKYDNCFAAAVDVKQRYTAMRDALNETGRPIYFSMCEWGVAAPWQWAKSIGNSWRTDQDIEATWDSVVRCLDNGAAGLAKYAGPGGWNDPDMLEVGVGSLTPAQQHSHFALWALVKSPLLIGANLDTISPTSLAILKAKEVIGINQDKLGVAGDIIWKEGPLEIWAAPLIDDARAVVLFNRHHAGLPVDITVSWSQLGYKAGFKAAVRDLYAERDLGVFEQSFTASVANFDVAVLSVSHPVHPSRCCRCKPSCPCTCDCSCSCEGGCESNSRCPSSTRTDHSATKQALRWWSGFVEQVCSAVKSLCGVRGHSREAAPCGCDCDGHSSTRGTSKALRETAWRPWHGTEAAALQLHLRDVARTSRLERLRAAKSPQVGHLQAHQQLHPLVGK